MSTKLGKNDKTSIDLGEDLLANDSDEVTRGENHSKGSDTETVEEVIHNAEILFSEGLIESAKKLLRNLLLKDQGLIAPKELLDKIQEKELQSLLKSGVPKTRAGPAQTDALMGNLLEIDSVISKLNRDLSLELDTIPELLRDAGDHLPFADSLDEIFSAATPQDRIDLGVGFYEMGLTPLAIRQFQAAKRLSSAAPAQHPGIWSSATYLIAICELQAGRGFDAIQTLEELLGDLNLDMRQKTHIFYLLGRAHETSVRRSLALQWYLQVAQIDPHYRDVLERIRILQC